MGRIRTARGIIRRIEELGGYWVRTKRSHATYEAATYDDGGNVLVRAKAVVPIHSGDVAPGTVRSIQRQLAPVFGERVVAVMRTYHVVVHRDPEDARFWLADVDGLDGAHTSSRSLATLDRYVREVIVLAADLPDDEESEIQLEWTYLTGDPDVDREAERLRRRRAELESASQDLTEHTSAFARRLVTVGGFSVREAAALLSVSPARIDQMVQEPKKRNQAAA